MSHPEMGHRSHLSLKCEIEPWTIGSGAEWSWGRRPAHSLRQECSRDPDERRPQKPPAVSVWMLLPRDGWRRLGVRAAHSLSLIHISEPTRLGMISYAVFCLKKKNKI